MGNKIVAFLKKLKEKHDTSVEIYHYLYPAGSRPGILYDLCKIQKTKVDDGAPFSSSWATEIPFHKLIIFRIIMITTNLNH